MNLELFYCSQSEQLDNRSCKKELNAWHRQDQRKYFSTSCHTHTLSPLHCISIKSHIKYFGPKVPTPHPKNNPPYPKKYTSTTFVNCANLEEKIFVLKNEK